MPPTIVITRPEPQASTFAAALRQAHGGPLDILIAPLMKIESVDFPAPLTAPDHLIFTSANAVAQAAQLKITQKPLAWCVGQQTADAAAQAGFATRVAHGNSQDLVELIVAAAPTGHFLHLRGEHATGKIAEMLTAHGIPCAEVVVYSQKQQAPPKALLTALQAGDGVIVPLFSPRSAQLLGESAKFGSNVSIVAISDAVARVASRWPVIGVITAESPDKKGMIVATLRVYDAQTDPMMP